MRKIFEIIADLSEVRENNVCQLCGKSQPRVIFMDTRNNLYLLGHESCIERWNHNIETINSRRGNHE